MTHPHDTIFATARKYCLALRPTSKLDEALKSSFEKDGVTRSSAVESADMSCVFSVSSPSAPSKGPRVVAVVVVEFYEAEIRLSIFDHVH